MIIAELRLNMWPLRRLAIVSFCSLMLLLGLEILRYTDSCFSIVQIAVGLFYIFLVPGSLILRIINRTNWSVAESFALIVGLGILLQMVIGFALNETFLWLAWQGPITFLNIFIANIVIIIVLLVLNLYSHPSNSPVGRVFLSNGDLREIGFLSCLPIISSISALIMTGSRSNTLMIGFYLLVAIVIILIAVGRFFSEKVIPYAILMISVSLLFSTSLISEYITGFDIQIEYYFAQQTLFIGQWNSATYGDVNSLLSIGILSPIISTMTNLPTTLVLKVVYPIIYSVVPFVLFEIFYRQTNLKVAFYASIFFIGGFMFYAIMPYLAREEIGELMFVLLLLVWVKGHANRLEIAFLTISLGMGLIVSYYGLSYTFMVAAIVAVIILRYGHLFMKRVRKILHLASTQFDREGSEDDESNSNYRLTVGFVAIFAVFAFIWYGQFSGSSVFDTMIRFSSQILSNMWSGFFNVKTVEGLAIATQSLTPVREMTRDLYLMAQFALAVGILYVLLVPNRWRFRPEYLSMSVIFFVYAIAGLLIPYFSSSNTSRVFHTTLLVLAPFFAIGATCLIEWGILKLHKLIKGQPGAPNSLNAQVSMVMGTFLAVFLLLNTGLVGEIVGESSSSISLNSDSESPVFSSSEVVGASWASENSQGSTRILSDEYGSLLEKSYAYPRVFILGKADAVPSNGSLIFYRNPHVRDALQKEIIAFGVPAEQAGFGLRNYEESCIYHNMKSSVTILSI